MTGPSARELKSSAKDVRATVSNLVKGLDPSFKGLKLACDKLATAKKEYVSALSAFEKKENSKTTAKLERAKTALITAYEDYSSALSELSGKYDEITVNYARLVEVCEAISEREGNKAKSERDNFTSEYELRLSKVERGVADTLPAFLTEKPELTDLPTEKPASEEVAESAPAPTPAAAETVRPDAAATVATVNVAPVTIDVSSYVERAISATMDRLTVGMERKIAAYIDSLVIPKPEIPTPVTPAAASASVSAPAVDATVAEGLITTAKANNELLDHLLEEQTHIYEKLRGMITNVQTLVDGVTELSASCMSLAEKQRDAVEAQKQANDMQRHTAREQQGVQVNQKMISEEQLSISAEQALLTDRQKAVLDRQKSLAESQSAMEQTQKAVMDTHVALEEAMKVVMQAQKEIIATQQAIINGNAKNQEAQKLIIERQAEINAAQKEALAAHKQLLKEQRAHNDKLAAAGAKRAKRPAPSDTDSDEPPVAVDGPVVTEKAAPGPDTSKLSADEEFRG